jgi:thioredoxin 1
MILHYRFRLNHIWNKWDFNYTSFKGVSVYTMLFLLTTVFACESQQSSSLDAVGFHALLKKTQNAVVIDVRTPEEFSNGFVAGAVNIDYNNESFANQVSALNKTSPYFVYCLSGGRSSRAAEYMRSNGFKNVYELKGGILAWQKNNLPLTTQKAVPPSAKTDKISKEEYNLITKDTVPILIDFYAPWCAPCRKMEPMLNDLSVQNKGKLKVVRINVDENKSLAKELGVEAIPVLLIYRNGEKIWNHTGLATKEQILSAMK